jgi:hypothetical protein
MTELSRVLGLVTHLAAVSEVCNKAEASGAPRYAALLKKPIEGTVDSLLPETWRKAWRLKRLATYLESIDAQEELKKLAKDRHDVESDLSRAYRDVVVKRTWLKLAENASPRIRAALQAYLNAIQKIGKGTGKRGALPERCAHGSLRCEPRSAVLDNGPLPGVGITASGAGLLRPCRHRRSIPIRPQCFAFSLTGQEGAHRRFLKMKRPRADLSTL